jgi:hypothetical protein
LLFCFTTQKKKRKITKQGNQKMYRECDDVQTTFFRRHCRFPSHKCADNSDTNLYKVCKRGAFKKDRNILDAFLTSISIFLIFLSFQTFFRESYDSGIFFTVCMFATWPAIFVLKKCFFTLAPFLGVRSVTKKRVNRVKFADQSWQFAVHVSMFLFESWIYAQENCMPWAETTSQFWSDVYIPNATKQQSVQRLYCVQLGIYAFMSFSHRFLEARHKDYFMMLIHHIVTMCLLVFSYRFNYVKIGLAVLYVHDASDIFIDIMKCTNYLGLESRHGYFVVEAAYVANLFSWGYFRLYVLPMHILYSTLYARTPNEKLLRIFLYGDQIDNVFRIGLLVLVCMHVFWLWLIVRIGLKMFVSGLNPHDAGAEEYEGESDAEE